jgi:uncharacterized membrane-anchored protein
MNKKKLIFSLFIATFILQLFAVAGIIARYEIILATGKSFKFRTAPVDPYDAFRGRYVALDIKESNVKCKNYNDFERGERVYAIIEVDEDGFAKFAKLQHEKPQDGIDYLKVKIRNAWSDEITLYIPFDRFYMEETEALKAENAYRAQNRKENTYIEVKVWNGYGVIDELFIDGTPVRDYINK